MLKKPTIGRGDPGVIWVNTYNQLDAAAPFGGYKHGYGREMGHAVLEAYTQTKTVWINLR